MADHGLNRCHPKFLTSRHVRMHRVIFYISNTLTKLMIKAQGLGKCIRIGFGRGKEKTFEV